MMNLGKSGSALIDPEFILEKRKEVMSLAHLDQVEKSHICRCLEQIETDGKIDNNDFFRVLNIVSALTRKIHLRNLLDEYKKSESTKK